MSICIRPWNLRQALIFASSFFLVILGSRTHAVKKKYPNDMLQTHQVVYRVSVLTFILSHIVCIRE
ncbi:hypothetical protein F5Y02DRAFT_403097 [Annulohypoxylon stygium]|nr:hypothetical protein F5Y02DRAFT_403097 [Annulohypoxylon stygium]